MPNRYVRESAIESERVNKLSWQAEVFYRRLINRVDDFGRYTAHPELLRASIFPMQLNKVNAADVVKLLLECEQAGLVSTWKGQFDGKPYLAMARWEQGRAKESKYPKPPDNVYKCLQTFANVPDSDTDSDTDYDQYKEKCSLEEAISFGKNQHPPYSESLIREWFSYRDSNRWLKNHGGRIGSWRSDLTTWWLKHQRENGTSNRTEADKRRDSKRGREYQTEGQGCRLPRI